MKKILAGLAISLFVIFLVNTADAAHFRLDFEAYAAWVEENDGILGGCPPYPSIQGCLIYDNSIPDDTSPQYTEHGYYPGALLSAYVEITNSQDAVFTFSLDFTNCHRFIDIYHDPGVLPDYVDFDASDMPECYTVTATGETLNNDQLSDAVITGSGIGLTFSDSTGTALQNDQLVSIPLSVWDNALWDSMDFDFLIETESMGSVIISNAPVTIATISEVNPIPELVCSGFDSPMDAGAVKVNKNRVLPLKAQLLDSGNNPITDNEVVAPPVVQIFFDSGIALATDVTDDALVAGMGTEGNQFEFGIDKWQFNLKTKNYSATGTYSIKMESGDSNEYTISPTCSAEFVIH